VAAVELLFFMLHQISAPREFHCVDCSLDLAQRTVAVRKLRLRFFFRFVVGDVREA
jgi:hypothetical protein